MTYIPSPIFLVALGGAAGAITRHLFVSVFDSLFSASFSLGTIGVNLLGCFAAGAVAASVAGFSQEADTLIRPLIVTGFLGAFTTFSAFSLDVLTLLHSMSLFKASVVMSLHVFGSIFAVVFGFKVASL